MYRSVGTPRAASITTATVVVRRHLALIVLFREINRE
jgi:hypothetical protein